MHDWWANDERRIARFEPWFRMGKNNWKMPGNGARHSGRHFRMRQNQVSMKSHYFINRYEYIQCSFHPVNRKPEDFPGNLPEVSRHEKQRLTIISQKPINFHKISSLG